MGGLAQIEATVTRLEAEVKSRLTGYHSPVLSFPGTNHGIDDGTPGESTVLRWRSVERLREDCVPGAVDAWMVDRSGEWLSVETTLAPMPALEGSPTSRSG